MLSMFNHYPTFQLFLALVISMALTVAVMPAFIKLLRHREIGQQVRADGPEGHLVKQGTPTMGGVVILLMMCLSVFIVYAPGLQLLLVAAATLLTGLLGFVDDAADALKKQSDVKETEKKADKDAADQLGVIRLVFAGDLPGDDYGVVFDEGFHGDAALRVLAQTLGDNGVGNLIADLVRMPFCH